MKLSEAIRAGAKLRPQVAGVIFDGNRTCALGAALEGAGYDLRHCMLNSTGIRNVSLRWPDVACAHARCPVARCRTLVEGASLRCVVMHLNDGHGWSREAIAEWVETVEKRLEAEAEMKAAAESAPAEIPEGVPLKV